MKLSSFKDMFGLEIHKEMMPYKLYTQDVRERKTIPIQEFIDAYARENPTFDDEFVPHPPSGGDGLAAIMTSMGESGAIVTVSHGDSQVQLIDIIQYARFYCMKDCAVLMLGLEKFARNLVELFKISLVKMPPLSHFLSVSSIGYQFAKAYGCFDECYDLAGKPKQFIQRCVSGGRCMTRNNEKLRVRGKLQDFDAVSLYPSAMFMMPGIAKGMPQVIGDEDIWQYDTFFVEINITELKCKCADGYTFGQVFVKGGNGSKMFGNQHV
jgi:hypothetical protein